MVDLSKENSVFARLEGVRYPSTRYNMPNKKLPEAIFKECSALYYAITGGKEFEQDDFTISVKANSNGEFEKMFGPSVLAAPEGKEGLVVKWGMAIIPVVLEKGKFSFKLPDDTIDGTPESEKLYTLDQCDLVEATFGYNEPELALKILLDTPDDFYDVNLPIRFTKYPAPKMAEVKTMLKKDPEAFFELLYKGSEGAGSSSSSDSEVRSMSDFVGDPLVFSDFEAFTYENSSTGKQVQAMLMVDKEGIKYWANDILATMAPRLSFPVTVTVHKVTDRGYIEDAEVEDNEGVGFGFGNDHKVWKSEDIAAGDYLVWGVRVIPPKGNRSFTSYILDVESVEAPDTMPKFFSAFAHSRVRGALSANPVIDIDHSAELKVHGPKSASLTPFYEEEEGEIDVDSLFD